MGSRYTDRSVGSESVGTIINSSMATSNKLSNTRRNLSLFARLRLLPKYMWDEAVPAWRKALLLMGVLYIISPLDAIPEIVLPLVGWLDDLGLLAVLTVWTYREIGKWEA